MTSALYFLTEGSALISSRAVKYVSPSVSRLSIEIAHISATAQREGELKNICETARVPFPRNSS